MRHFEDSTCWQSHVSNSNFSNIINSGYFQIFFKYCQQQMNEKLFLQKNCLLHEEWLQTVCVCRWISAMNQTFIHIPLLCVPNNTQWWGAGLNKNCEKNDHRPSTNVCFKFATLRYYHQRRESLRNILLQNICEEKIAHWCSG